MNPWLTSALRITRMLAYIISTIATPFYVAVVNYHRGSYRCGFCSTSQRLKREFRSLCPLRLWSLKSF